MGGLRKEMEGSRGDEDKLMDMDAVPGMLMQSKTMSEAKRG